MLTHKTTMFHVMIEDTVTRIVHQMKYLGFILDKRVTWQAHKTHAANMSKTMVNLFRPLVERQSKLNLRNKRLLFKAMITPTMFYGAAA